MVPFHVSLLSLTILLSCLLFIVYCLSFVVYRYRFFYSLFGLISAIVSFPYLSQMTNVDTGCLLHAGCAIVSRSPVSYGRRVLYIRLFNVFTYTDPSAFQHKSATCAAHEDPFNKKKDHLLAATIDKVQSGGYKYVLLLSPKHLATDR